MKNIVLAGLITCLGIEAAAQQQWINATIDVRDATSGKIIPLGTVSSYKAGQSYNIDNGKLELRYNKEMLTDTLFIDVQGYEKHKITYADLISQGKKSLNVQPKPADIPISDLKKSEILNDYNNKAVFHWIGLPLEDRPFRYLQVGQVYENPQVGAKLSEIKLNQLVFSLPNNVFYDDGSMMVGSFTYANYPARSLFKEDDKNYMHSYLPGFLQSSKFKLRIYQLDAKNQPIAELCTTPILIDREPAVENTNVNLSKYNIILPAGKFMVAVEWIPTQRNFSYVSFTKEMYPMGQSLRPYLGINEKKGNKLNVMALDYAGNWTAFDYLSPYYTDLAMECQIKY